MRLDIGYPVNNVTMDDYTTDLPSYDGLLLPPFPRFEGHPQKGLEEIKDFPTRKSDVLVCGTMKSGNHWLFEIVSMILTGNLNFTNEYLVSNLLDFADFDALKIKLDPRVLHTHLPIRWLPGHGHQKDYKVVHIMRNPKDRVVSLYHYIEGKKGVLHHMSWNTFFHVNVMNPGREKYGCWFQNVKEAEIQSKLKHLHLLYYEDLMRNFEDTAKKLADFLEIKRSDSFYTSLEHVCSFENMKNNKPDDTVVFDKEARATLYRKGKIGDWKNYFTVAQNDRFNAMYDARMADSELQFIYE